MIQLPCPWCGPRDAAEFAYLGPPPARPSDPSPEAWRDYLYSQENPLGWTTEVWFHRRGCRRFLRLRRHTLTGEAGGARDAAP